MTTISLRIPQSFAAPPTTCWPTAPTTPHPRWGRRGWPYPRRDRRVDIGVMLFYCYTKNRMIISQYHGINRHHTMACVCAPHPTTTTPKHPSSPLPHSLTFRPSPPTTAARRRHHPAVAAGGEARPHRRHPPRSANPRQCDGGAEGREQCGGGGGVTGCFPQCSCGRGAGGWQCGCGCGCGWQCGCWEWQRGCCCVVELAAATECECICHRISPCT